MLSNERPQEKRDRFFCPDYAECGTELKTGSHGIFGDEARYFRWWCPRCKSRGVIFEDGEGEMQIMTDDAFGCLVVDLLDLINLSPEWGFRVNFYQTYNTQRHEFVDFEGEDFATFDFGVPVRYEKKKPDDPAQRDVN
jgi:hypothetical protein